MGPNKDNLGKRVSWFSRMSDDETEGSPTPKTSVRSLFDGQGRYGWCGYTPDCLQCLATPVGALLFLCLQPLIEGFIVNGAARAGITHIETRFGLRSFESGVVNAAFDIASFIFLIPVTHFGGAKTANRAHWVGFGTMIVGTGSIIFSSPAFLTSPYNPGQSDLCSNEYPETEKAETYFLMFCILTLGNFVHGMGATPLFTLAVSYIDDYVERSKASIFLGVYYMMVVIGPALGFAAGGMASTLHTDFYREHEENKDFTPQSVQWVGAWWLPILICGFLCFLVAIPVLGLPRKLAAHKRKASMMIDERVVEDPTVKNLFPSIVRVLTNYPFVFLTFAGCCDAMLIAAFTSFIVKIFFIQFGLTTKKFALVMGSAIIPSCLIGFILGSFIIKQWDLSTTAVIKLCMVLTGMATCLQFGLFLYCDQKIPKNMITDDKIVNTHVLRWGLSEKCNQNCHCGTFYKPVCDSDGNSFYSPCIAGCVKETDVDKQSHYHNCSCVVSDSKEAQTCDSACNIYMIIIAVFLMSMYNVVTFSSAIPAITATLRSVHPDLKSFSLGIQWLIMRLIGSVPAPMIYGLLFDSTCSLWTEGGGSCIIYDQQMLAKSLFFFNVGIKVLQFIFFSIAFVLYKKRREAEEKKRGIKKK